MDELEAAARALFLARSPNADWTTLDGATKDVFRIRAKSNAAEAALAAPPAAPAAPPVTWKQAAEEVAADEQAAEDEAPKPKKTKSK